MHWEGQEANVEIQAKLGRVGEMINPMADDGKGLTSIRFEVNVAAKPP